jgi:hypothetical protein
MTVTHFKEVLVKLLHSKARNIAKRCLEFILSGAQFKYKEFPPDKQRFQGPEAPILHFVTSINFA